MKEIRFTEDRENLADYSAEFLAEGNGVVDYSGFGRSGTVVVVGGSVWKHCPDYTPEYRWELISGSKESASDREAAWALHRAEQYVRSCESDIRIHGEITRERLSGLEKARALIAQNAQEKTEEVQIMNCTPHPVTVAGETISPSGNVPRLGETVEEMGSLNGIPLISKKMGALEGLPEAKENTAVIVSILCAQVAWAQGRRDVLAAGESVRDENGRIVGCKSLACHPDGFSA